MATIREHGPAVLESVLGATPREFESRILRHTDLAVSTVDPYLLINLSTAGGVQPISRSYVQTTVRQAGISAAGPARRPPARRSLRQRR